jgi:transposase
MNEVKKITLNLTEQNIRELYKLGEDTVVATILQLQQSILELTARVIELESFQKKNSANSSKPPSTDKARKKIHSLNEKTGKKSGGQPGHPGSTLKQTATPAEIIIHSCEGLCSCGKSLSKVPIINVEKRQVFGLKPIEIHVVEHQAEICICDCGKLHKAQFPEGINAPVQYSKEIRGIVLYLGNYQILPFKRTEECMEDLFGLPISQGTFDTISNQAYQTLAPIEQYILEQLLVSQMIHADETGTYINTNRWWLMVLSNMWYTYYHTEKKRGLEGINVRGILDNFKGHLIHDCWKAYFSLACAHGLCNSHLLRELLFIAEIFEESWATPMKQLLINIKVQVETAQECNERSLPEEVKRINYERFDNLIAQGLVLERTKLEKGKRGKQKKHVAVNLLERMKENRTAVLSFMENFAIPFSNNLAERDIRMMKTKQKISGCFRSEHGAKKFDRIRGFISTLKKQGKNVLDYLSKIFDAQPLNYEQFLKPPE